MQRLARAAELGQQAAAVGGEGQAVGVETLDLLPVAGQRDLADLGLGTGATFAWVAQLAPPEKVGTVTGIVGAAGGLGGYFPPLVMGATYNEQTHSYTIGLILLCITALVTLAYTVFGIKKRQPASA